MSEPQITHIERADHVDHADNTEQAETVTNAEHVETVKGLDLHIDSVGSNKLRILKKVREIILFAVVLAALAVTALAIWNSIAREDRTSAELAVATAQAEANAALIESLRAELEKGAKQLKESVAIVESDREAEADRVECVTRFTYAIQLAQGEQISAQSELVSVIYAVPPGPERVTAGDDAYKRIGTAQVAYDLTVQQRIDYDVAGTPLPCPLPPGLNER